MGGSGKGDCYVKCKKIVLKKFLMFLRNVHSLEDKIQIDWWSKMNSSLWSLHLGTEGNDERP